MRWKERKIINRQDGASEYGDVTYRETTRAQRIVRTPKDMRNPGEQAELERVIRILKEHELYFAHEWVGADPIKLG